MTVIGQAEVVNTKEEAPSRERVQGGRHRLWMPMSHPFVHEPQSRRVFGGAKGNQASGRPLRPFQRGIVFHIPAAQRHGRARPISRDGRPPDEGRQGQRLGGNTEAASSDNDRGEQDVFHAAPMRSIDPDRGTFIPRWLIEVLFSLAVAAERVEREL